MPAPFVNFHTHLPITGLNETGLYNAGLQELSALPEHPGPVSVGIHPWHLRPETIGQDLQQLETLLNHPRVRAVGETGLDRNIKVPLPVQREVLEAHVQLAEKWQLPLIIHCVKAFPELIAVKKATRSTVPWIIHGFNNKWAVASGLIPHGFYLSFGAALLNGGFAAGEVLQKMEAGRFFLETDDSPLPIDEVYLRAAALRNTPVEDLQENLYVEFSQLFNARNN